MGAHLGHDVVLVVRRGHPQGGAQAVAKAGVCEYPGVGHLVFDPTFDFCSDAGGDDPDWASPTLKQFHKQLWSKPLPDGCLFALDDTDDAYLRHTSERGTFLLSSDTSVPTWASWKRMQPLICQIPERERDEFDRITYQMGAMMLFPRNRVGRQWTINQARGCTGRIDDRLDLTVECIRLHYLGVNGADQNPLGPTLALYRDFFDLFTNFAGYVNFFLLQDLVNGDGTEVRFFLPSNSFHSPGSPQTLDEYRDYREHALAFVQSRNQRMLNDIAGR